MTPKRGAAVAPIWFALALQLAGCAASPERQAEMAALFQVKPDPALFSAASPASAPATLPLKVALLVLPGIPGASAALPPGPGAWMISKKESPASWRLQAGAIVELALLKTLRQAVQGESTVVPSMPLPDAGYSGTLELVSVRFDYDESVRFLVPLPIPILFTMVGEFEASMRLSIQISLFDAQGRQVWTKAYDDDTRKGVWGYPFGNAAQKGDPDWLPGVKRAAHEAAWRLSQRALHDLSDWYDAERLRPRSL